LDRIDDDGIDKSKSKSYETYPLDKIGVYIEDERARSYVSIQFILKAGDGKTFTYETDLV
jgi:hypothetical protein